MTALDEPPPGCFDQGTQTCLDEQAQHPGILALLVHNVQSPTAFEDGYARYWADAKARAPGMKGCTCEECGHHLPSLLLPPVASIAATPAAFAGTPS